MKLLILIVALLLSTGARAAVAISDGPFTAHTTLASTHSTETITGVSITAGSIVVVFYGFQDNGEFGPYTVTDNSGATTTWSAATALSTTSAHTRAMFFWAYTAAGFASKTITLNYTSAAGSTDSGIAVVGISGAKTSAPISGTGIFYNTNTALPSVTVAATGSGSMILMGVSSWSANAMGTVDGNSTSLATWGTVGVATFGLQRETSLVSPGSYTLTRTLTADEAAASGIEILDGGPVWTPNTTTQGATPLIFRPSGK